MNLNSISVQNYHNSLIVKSSDVNHPNFRANSERAPFYPETLETIDNIYRDYKKSLGETTLSDVKSTALNLSQEMQIPKKEVLKAMQLVTQFSNIHSLKVISDSISKQHVASIGDKDMCLQFHSYDKELDQKNKNLFYSETGINSSLAYVFDKKRIAPINYHKSGKLGIILDEEKISQLEEIKKTQPDEFKDIANDKELKYFYISGWDTGIPVIDRTKSLEDMTRELLIKSKEENKPLEKVLDEPLLNRIKELGIKPVIIKNDNPATELGIYNQMKPQQISKLHLTNIIEANSIYRANELAINSDCKKAFMNDKTTKYLEDTLCVYTPEKMSADLKTIHEKITDYANSKGKDVLYIRPKTTLKSTDYIHYSYKKINNVDPSKFISIHSLNTYNKEHPEKPPVNPENTILVFLDDCTISGDSIDEIREDFLSIARISPKYSLLFANLKGTDEAYNDFYRKKRSNPADLIILDKINQKSLKSDKNLKTVVGDSAFSTNASSMIFPYMAPDNNSEIASNIALMHNLNYRSQNFSDPKNRSITTSTYQYHNSASRTMTSNVKKTSFQYINIMGLNPTKYEAVTETNTREVIDKPEKKEQKSFWDKLKSFIHK